MDMLQIRQSFLRSSIAEEKIRVFRKMTLKELEVPAHIGTYPVWVVLHIASIPAVTSSRMVDAQALLAVVRKVRAFGGNERADSYFNLDGVRKGNGSAHVQFYRDGRVQARWIAGNVSGFETKSLISMPNVVDTVRYAVAEYLHGLISLEFQPPFAVMLSLVNTAAAKFALTYDQKAPDRGVLDIPEILIVDIQKSTLDTALNQIMDMLYQAFGEASAPRSI